MDTHTLGEGRSAMTKLPPFLQNMQAANYNGVDSSLDSAVKKSTISGVELQFTYDGANELKILTSECQHIGALTPRM